MQQRNNSVTYSKAFAILLMVVGHSQCNVPYTQEMITMFHMPLFFFFSGYCLKEKYLDAPKDFFMRRVKGLYVPFVKWTTVFSLLVPLFFYLHILDENYGLHGEGTPMMSIADILNSIYLAVFQMRGFGCLLGGYWFLNALFFGSIIAWIILHFVRKPIHSTILAFILLLIVNATNFHIVFLNLNTRTFLAAFFIVAGYCFANIKVKPFTPIGIVASFIATFIGTKYWQIHVDHSTYDGFSVLPYCVTAILATWSVYSAFTPWKETANIYSRLLSFIGNNTLTILTWHFLAFKLVSLFIVKYYNLEINRIAEYPTIDEYAFNGWWAVYFIVAIIACCCIAAVRDRLSVLKESIVSSLKNNKS